MSLDILNELAICSVKAQSKILDTKLLGFALIFALISLSSHERLIYFFGCNFKVVFGGISSIRMI